MGDAAQTFDSALLTSDRAPSPCPTSNGLVGAKRWFESEPDFRERREKEAEWERGAEKRRQKREQDATDQRELEEKRERRRERERALATDPGWCNCPGAHDGFEYKLAGCATCGPRNAQRGKRILRFADVVDGDGLQKPWTTLKIAKEMRDFDRLISSIRDKEAELEETRTLLHESCHGASVKPSTWTPVPFVHPSLDSQLGHVFEFRGLADGVHDGVDPTGSMHQLFPKEVDGILRQIHLAEPVRWPGLPGFQVWNTNHDPCLSRRVRALSNAVQLDRAIAAETAARRKSRIAELCGWVDRQETKAFCERLAGANTSAPGWTLMPPPPMTEHAMHRIAGCPCNHDDDTTGDDDDDDLETLSTPQSEGGSSAVKLLRCGQTGTDCSVCRAHSWSSRVAVQRFVDAAEHRDIRLPLSDAPGSPPFEGFVAHNHPAAACNCHRFDSSVRTDPSECDHPSHHLERGAAGVRELREILKGLGIPVWRDGAPIPALECVQNLSNHHQAPAASKRRWADAQLARKRRAVDKGAEASAKRKAAPRAKPSRPSRFLPFEQALAFARGLHLTSAVAWRAWNKTGARPVNIPGSPDSVYKHVGWQGWSHWLSRSRGEAWAADDECATDEQKADRARLAAPGAAARASERERARERDFALGVEQKQDSDSLEAFLQHEKMRRQGRCDSCNDFPAPGQCLKKCGGCGGPRYCSLECQSTDWPSHKAQCMAARAARK